MPFENQQNFLLMVLIAVLFSALIFYLLKVMEVFPFIVILMILLFVPMTYRMRRLFPDWVRPKDIIGEVQIESNRIFLLKEEEELKKEDIKKISLRLNYIKGEKYGRSFSTQNGMTEFQITQKTGEEKSFRVVLETKDQFIHLKEVLKSWYRAGIDIQERFGDNQIKTICLEPIADKYYAQVQELKQQLGQKD
jgi:hypothetical protein